MKQGKSRLIESDRFPFEFLSGLAERESWRKEVHRPVYHIHKWWAKRLGSVFRGILLGCALSEDADLPTEFYKIHQCSGAVFDPFMGSGTTVGEAHKLGFHAFGRDINPVAVNAVRVALGAMDRQNLEKAFEELSKVEKVRSLYRSVDSRGRVCDVLYYFWVMQANCPKCTRAVDLFPSWVVARNAYPDRKPEIQILCPGCGDIFPGLNTQKTLQCRSCGKQFNPDGPVKGAKATCTHCGNPFTILAAIGGKRPRFRLYGKLVLTLEGEKEYLRATDEDVAFYEECSRKVQHEEESGEIALPTLALEDGYNTRQAISYGFKTWRDFFNDRQLLALGRLQAAIAKIPDAPSRDALLTLFSGVLEFNNMFASYKGEGTGAVRHMFSHHILKPERTPIEANPWGTPKSSGAFLTLYRSRLLRALEYRAAPTEVNGTASAKGKIASLPFTGKIYPWSGKQVHERGIYLSCGDSAKTELPDKSIDFVVTDPPFFDNVHYSELADFFHAWQQLLQGRSDSTRRPSEVQDSNAERFAMKLSAVFCECRRILKDQGLLVFTYHHSRDEGWKSLAEAVFQAGFVVVQSYPVKAEMSVATPKSQAKEPIQLDIIIVCQKRGKRDVRRPLFSSEAVSLAREQIKRLCAVGLKLSRNDCKITLFGQLLATLRCETDIGGIARRMEEELAELETLATL